MSGFPAKGLGISHGGFGESAFGDFLLYLQSLVFEGVFGGHGDHAVEGTGTVIRARGTHHNFLVDDIEFAGTEEISQRKIESGRLVVDPVNHLQGTHGTGAIESAGIHDAESEAGAGNIHAFEVAEGFVKIGGRRFADTLRAHAFHCEGRFFEFLFEAILFDGNLANFFGVFGRRSVFGYRLGTQLNIRKNEDNS